jgi:hypothetical protein
MEESEQLEMRPAQIEEKIVSMERQIEQYPEMAWILDEDYHGHLFIRNDLKREMERIRNKNLPD